jgi:hypothetical protein
MSEETKQETATECLIRALEHVEECEIDCVVVFYCKKNGTRGGYMSNENNLFLRLGMIEAAKIAIGKTELNATDIGNE